MTHGTVQEADMETTHEKLETNTFPGAIDKTIAMIHARDMDKDTILESAGRIIKTERFHLSHVMTGDKTAKTQTLAVELHKTDLNHHTKTDNMTLILILDNEATIMQLGPKTRHARIAKELFSRK